MFDISLERYIKIYSSHFRKMNISCDDKTGTGFKYRRSSAIDTAGTLSMRFTGQSFPPCRLLCVNNSNYRFLNGNL